MPSRHETTSRRPCYRSSGRLLIAAVVVLAATAGATGMESQPARERVRGVAGPDACSCLEDFDALVRNVETNYVGYALYVTGDRRRDFEQLEGRLRDKAGRVSPDECVFVVRELIDWFGDDHLFVIEQPYLSADSVARLTAAAAASARDTAVVLRQLRSGAAGADPIEGSWFSKHGLRTAVVRDQPGGNDDFVAVMISDTTSGWAAGQIKARFKRQADSSYAATVYGANHAPRHYTARLYRDLLLHMPPLTWGRDLPAGTPGDVVLDRHDPRAPMLRVLDGGHVLLSIPSHDPTYRPRLDSLVAEHDSVLRVATTLVIDLRGNEGGSSLTTRVLSPYLHTEEQRPPLGAQGPPAILVSDDNLAYFKQLGVPDSMLARLASRRGQVVEVPPSTRDASADTLPELARPAHVAILVDRGVVSAGEAFLLSAMRNTKVTVFGENTGGVIDLQNVRIVRLACRGRGLLLGYPTIAASAELPDGGLNAIGIAPDVRIPAGVEDPIAFILSHYREADRQ
jgi:hypothetical protein